MVGPIIIWRKEIRPDSGGAGRQRGGLGQIIEVGPTDGYLFEFSAMFDRVDNPARGRDGGHPGAPGSVVLDDGSLWQIDRLERLDASLWLPITSITVANSSRGSPGYDYVLINTDDGERAHAKYIGQRVGDGLARLQRLRFIARHLT